MTPDSSAWEKRSSQSVEQLHPHVTRFWMDKGRIVCYTITSVSRAAIDVWADSSLALIMEWPADQPYLAIHDFSEATLTPYVRKRAEDIVSQIPKHFTGRSAVIMPRSFINQLIRLFVTVDLVNRNRVVDRQVFFRIEEASQWVKKAIKA
jgi:hypothetical protein